MKNILKLLLIALVTLSLAACVSGGSEGSPSSGEETTPSGEETAQTPKTEKHPASEWDDTIAYADGISNVIRAAFTDGSRSAFRFSNEKMSLTYDLKGKKRVSEMTNAAGVPYFTDSADVFAAEKDGTKSFASSSSESGRMNTYRMGYYYRDIHVLDQIFHNSFPDEKSGSLDLLEMVNGWGTNLATVPEKGEDGIYSFTVEDPYDPFVYSLDINFPTEKYNTIEIEMACEVSTFAQFFFVAGDAADFSAQQSVDFNPIPDGEFHTYTVPLASVPDFAKDLHGLRLDVGSVKGEQIRVRSIKATHIRFVGPSLALDKTYHTYSDKLNVALHFVCTGEVNTLDTFGTEIRFDEKTVDKVILADQNGLHDSPDAADEASTEYIGIDVKGAGVFGVIKIISEEESTLSLTREDGFYVLRISKKAEKESYVSGDEFTFGYRVYNDESHSFDGLTAEAEIERHPLTVDLDSTEDGARYLGYDALRGCYSYYIDGTDFNTYYTNKTRLFNLFSTVNESDNDRVIYILGTTESAGCLENAVLLDRSQNVLPINVEVAKNFGGEHEEPLFDKTDTPYGEALFPIVVKKDESYSFQLSHIYCNWGAYPVKQLSSIQFVSPYYHLSCGSTETNCIATYYVYGKDLWTLPDFRAMSAPFWSSQPQHTSVGRLYWLSYTSEETGENGTEFVSDSIDASGPSYADISMEYLSDDGRIRAEYRHTEMPQYDENRTLYDVTLTVLDDLTIADFKKDFRFFTFDGRMILFRKMGYLDANNEEKLESIDLSSPSDTFITLGTECPYFDYFSSSAKDYVNFALLIRDSEITLNGKKIDSPFVIRTRFTGTLNICDLTLDLGRVTLKKGDTFHISMVLLPWGSNSSSSDLNVKKVRSDSCLKPFSVTAEVGTVIEDGFVPKVRAENGQAVFTVSDGGGVTAVRVYGFDSFIRPKIEEKVGEEWKACEISSNRKYDGCMVYRDADGTYSFSFCIPSNKDTSRTYRVTAN